MRVAVALGGNALLKRGEPMTVDQQRGNVRRAARALAPIGRDHELIISHGNGPQVGLLALQAAACEGVDPYPLDILGAQTEGMLGYMIEQELGNLMPVQQPFATILTMVEVAPDDPAFAHPTKPIGPVLTREEAHRLARDKGWTVARDGEHWRRVVPSPLPKRIFEIRPIQWLLERGVIVICTGGGGIPTMYGAGGRLEGTEVVIDKDRASAVLAREVGADLLVLATDVDGVYLDWGEPGARLLRRGSPEELASCVFSSGSMGPKVEAACAFVRETGHPASIGCLNDLPALVAGTAGTRIEAGEAGGREHRR
ncbi:MAG: carbamate kinase [Acidobacteriota bacterium]